MMRTIELRRALRALVLFAPALALAACNTDDLLKVQDVSRLQAETVEDPAYAGLLVNGAVAQFECAHGAFVLVEGIIADELSDAQFNGGGWALDRRDANTNPGGAYGENGCDSNQVPGIYTPLSIARYLADNALTLIGGWTDAEVSRRDSLLAVASLYSGFSYAELGMSMCSAAIDGGPEQTPAQLFAIAEKRFDDAISLGGKAGVPSVVNAAKIGRARVRLFQGNTTGAVADAEQVPANFSFDATASTDNNRRNNRIHSANIRTLYYSVEPLAQNLKTEGVADPRMKAVNSGRRGQDGSTVWYQQKYTSQSAPTPIARSAEAQLIIAEVKGGQTAVDIINVLRTKAGVPTFTGTDEAAIQTAVIEERRRELFLEGFRLYDIERKGLPLNPAPGTPYQASKSGYYGDTTCLPLPDVERFNNPSLRS